MNLPELAVNEFKDIYQRKFGKTLSYNDAEIKAVNFLNLTNLLINGLNKTENQNLNIKTKNEQT